MTGGVSGDRLAERVIVITGAGGGFGALVAGIAAERGAVVVGADIDGDAPGGRWARSPSRTCSDPVIDVGTT